MFSRLTATLPPNERLLIGNQLGEILASDDEGASFLQLTNGLPNTSDSQSINMLASSPDQPGLVLAVVVPEACPCAAISALMVAGAMQFPPPELGEAAGVDAAVVAVAAGSNDAVGD